MDYRLDLLSESEFENLVNRVCQNLLGMGMISFSAGKDGGRDGKFTGTSNSYPSEKNPWKGKFIIQAKHTASPIASCSDSDFKTAINNEIKSIKTLKANGDIDCYLLFTNRKYPAIEGERLVKKIQTETGLSNVVIVGKESLNDLYLNPNKDIVREFQLDLNHIPFSFSESEIKDIILEFHSELPKIKTALEAEVDRIKFDFDRIKIEEKNKKNLLSKEYYENEILNHSLQDFEKIEAFLSDSRNEDYKEQYFDIAAELRNLIQLKRSNFASFEEIFIYIYKKISDGNKLKGKRHIFTLLHFMYYECLIGVK
ncbi:ABC-three component system protein [Flavobacterium johnsoniae]|uniref:ABC-three component system protein n=1 Tax=Flavobacterium johnsoniae TaxID=986 RepID=UPI0011EC7BD1|nr:ABC-three component system protein [Flavobacterium johnsoniae]